MARVMCFVHSLWSTIKVLVVFHTSKESSRASEWEKYALSRVYSLGAHALV